MSNPTLIVVYDPNGVVGFTPIEYLRRHGVKEARLPIADDLSEATIAGYATRLGLLLLEQLAPPAHTLHPLSVGLDPSWAWGQLYLNRSLCAFGGYADEAGEVELGVPLVADSFGRFPIVYGPPGRYSVSIYDEAGKQKLCSFEVTLPMGGSI